MKNTKKWSQIEEIKSTITVFNTNNDKIIELNKEYDRDISPEKSEKALSKEDLINLVVPVCNVLQVYA